MWLQSSSEVYLGPLLISKTEPFATVAFLQRSPSQMFVRILDQTLPYTLNKKAQ